MPRFLRSGPLCSFSEANQRAPRRAARMCSIGEPDLHDGGGNHHISA